MKSIKFHIIIINLIIILFQNSKSKKTRVSIDDDSLDDYYALPNEFPELISTISTYSTDKKLRIEKIRKLIGYLPFPEQRLLLTQTNTEKDYLFNYDTFYIHYYNLINDKDETIDIYQKEIESISKYVENYEKTLSIGLGCLKSVTQKFGYKTQFNIEMTNRIYENINIILKAQEKSNKCTAKFIHDLQTILVKRRKYLFTLKLSEIKVNNSDLGYLNKNNDNFCYNDDGEIISVNFPNNENDSDKNLIINSFKEYAKCKEDFNQILLSYSMDSEISITQMDCCLDFSKINENAGNSSLFIDEPNIVYKNDRKQIGINNISLIRSDQRTSNGYLLNFGFGFGNTSRENKTFPYPVGFYEKINKIFNILKEDFHKETIIEDDKPTILYHLQNLLLNNEEKRPFKDLIKEILENFENKEILNKFNELINNKMKDPYVISCKYHDKDLFSCYDYSDFSLPETSLNLVKKDNSFYKFSSEIIEAIRYKSKYYIYAEAIENNKKVYSFIYNGEELETIFYQTIQSCFGVFSSGGYNDKEACRDIIKEKCGTELDYKCKKSGLYDYINSNPVSNYLPNECSEENFNFNKCFEWINKHFLLGSIAIKPSSLLSFSLLQQSNIENNNLNKENNIPVSFFYDSCKNLTLNDESESESGKFYDKISENIKSESKYYPNILGSTPLKEGDISIQHYYVDQGNYNLLKSKSEFLNVKIVLIFFLLFCLMF
jgi:hypothetical protein